MSRSFGSKTVLTAVAAVAALALAACGGSKGSPLGGGTSGSGSADTITVGSGNFTESALLAEIYAGALEAKGVKVAKKLNIGARDVYIPALKDGSVDLVPEYTGVLLDYFSKGKAPKVSSPDDVYAALQKVVPSGMTLLDKSAAEDKDTLSVSKATATKYNLKSIADLKPQAKNFVIGAGPEFETRQQGIVGLKSVYGLTFKQFKPLDAGGPLTIKSLADGSIQVGNVFSTSSAIKTNSFVVLTDPENLFTAQNVVPLINTTKASDTVKAALNGVSSKLTTEVLVDLLSQVEVEKADPATVAKKFLSDNGLS
jgi:osmoprotectant transport system substrate-binding protein